MENFGNRLVNDAVENFGDLSRRRASKRLIDHPESVRPCLSTGFALRRFESRSKALVEEAAVGKRGGGGGGGGGGVWWVRGGFLHLVLAPPFCFFLPFSSELLPSRCQRSSSSPFAGFSLL